MERTMFLILSFMIFLGAGAQKRVSEKFFDDIKERDDVAIMSFSKNIIDMLNINIQTDDDKNITDDLSEIKITIFDKSINPNNESEVINFFKKSSFNEIDLEESDKNMRVFVNRIGRTIHECHVGFVGDKKFVLISFFGDFNVNDLKSLQKSANNLKLNY